MAIDMTTVKQIMHNNKEVVKIEDGLGKVLWQKETGPEWHTLWNGSAWAKRTSSRSDSTYSKSTSSKFYTLPTEYTKFRFTFNYSLGNIDRSRTKFYNNGNTVDSLTSPLIIDNLKVPTYAGGVSNILGIYYAGQYSNKSFYFYLAIRINNNRELSIFAYGDNYTPGLSGTTMFTLTQIEAYY